MNYLLYEQLYVHYLFYEQLLSSNPKNLFKDKNIRVIVEE